MIAVEARRELLAKGMTEPVQMYAVGGDSLVVESVERPSAPSATETGPYMPIAWYPAST